MARNWLTVLPISLVLAMLLYVVIEWPMLRIRASVDRRTGRQREYYPQLSDLAVGPEGPVPAAAATAAARTPPEDHPNLAVDAEKAYRSSEAALTWSQSVAATPGSPLTPGSSVSPGPQK